VIGDLLEARSQEHPDRLFVVFEDDAQWSYRETAERAWTVAARLQELGVKRSDPVMSWLPNGPEALLAWFGANAAGCEFSPLNTGYRGRLLENALNLVQNEVLICHADLVPRLEGLNLPHLRQLVVVGGEAEGSSPGVDSILWSDLIGGAVLTRRPAITDPVEPWEDATILFTSGTTGPSKAVRRPYVLYGCMAEAAFDLPGVDANDRFLVCGPMFHGGADVPIYSMLRTGGSICIVQGFRTNEFWSQVRRWNCTVAWIHSAMSIFLSKAPERENDADNPLRLAMMAPMFPGMHRFAKRFNLRLYSVYGMTELPCPFSVVDPSEHQSLGTPLPGFEVRLVDQNDCEVADETPGELIVRHTRPWALTPGYKNQAEATARLWRNGWLHTGDVFVRGTAGDYRLVDRVKDSIRRRGENVSSIEVESEMLEHPDVVEAAAFAVPSDIEDDVMVAVVLSPGAAADPEGIIGFLRDRLPHFAIPRYLDFVEALPRTPSLRVDKNALRHRGITDRTWDRIAEGIEIKRETFRA